MGNPSRQRREVIAVIEVTAPPPFIGSGVGQNENEGATSPSPLLSSRS
jgi:hypothetical protein